MSEFQNLKTEIEQLSHNTQMIQEIDYMLCTANDYLNKFDETDWKVLHLDLPHWKDTSLCILAETLIWGCEGENVIANNYTFGYIFTLVDLSSASWLLSEFMFDFLDENKLESRDLLTKMSVKLDELKNTKYLNPEDYLYWSNLFNAQL